MIVMFVVYVNLGANHRCAEGCRERSFEYGFSAGLLADGPKRFVQ